MTRILIDMDDTVCDYRSAYEAAQAIEPDLARPQSRPGFFAGLAPIDGAIDGVMSLHNRFEIWFATAPTVRTPSSYTEKRLWVEKHFNLDMAFRLILIPNKSLLRADYLIDDMASGRGQESFEGKLIQFGVEPYPDWEAVLGYFNNR